MSTHTHSSNSEANRILGGNGCRRPQIRWERARACPRGGAGLGRALCACLGTPSSHALKGETKNEKKGESTRAAAQTQGGCVLLSSV